MQLMGWPWKTFMERRDIGREVRRYSDAALDNLAFSGYGGMLTTSNPAYSLGAGWIKFTDFDQSLVTNPRHVVTDTATDTLEFDVPGVWFMFLNFVYTHSESNQGRSINIRLINEATGVPRDPIPVGIARNQPTTNFSFSTLFDVGEGEVDDKFSVELGNGSSVSGNFSHFSWAAFHVAEYAEGASLALQSLDVAREKQA